RRAIEGAVVELVAGAVAAVVEGDDAKAVAGEKAHPAGLDPIVANARGKAVDQEHGLARALVDEGEPNATRDEHLHGACSATHCFSRGTGKKAHGLTPLSSAARTGYSPPRLGIHALP